jgi:hypothetical protein
MKYVTNNSEVKVGSIQKHLCHGTYDLEGEKKFKFLIEMRIILAYYGKGAKKDQLKRLVRN